MAHFFNNAATTPTNFVNVGLGQTVQVGCWGAKINGTFLSVACNDSSVASVVAPGTQTPDGMIRGIGVKGLRAGNVMLEGRLGAGGPVWAFTQIVVGATAASAGAAASPGFDAAVQSRRIVFNNPGDLRVVNDIAAGKGGGISIAPELQRLLATLSASGKVIVMSLFRRGQGPHGIVQPDGTVVCRGVDITGYAGAAVTLSDPSAAIDVVSNLISHFPSGKYDLGFPRPVGGDQHFDASEDVFFSVPDAASAHLAFLGRAGRPLNTMLQPARDRVMSAMLRSGAQFPIVYPDGLNHLHVKAY
jgi:hypothetical protein